MLGNNPQAQSVKQVSVKPPTYHGQSSRKEPAPRPAGPPSPGLWSTVRRLRWTEFRLLLELALHPGRVLSRQQLLSMAWDIEQLLTGAEIPY